MLCYLMLYHYIILYKLYEIILYMSITASLTDCIIQHAFYIPTPYDTSSHKVTIESSLAIRPSHLACITLAACTLAAAANASR